MRRQKTRAETTARSRTKRGASRVHCRREAAGENRDHHKAPPDLAHLPPLAPPNCSTTFSCGEALLRAQHFGERLARAPTSGNGGAGAHHKRRGASRRVAFPFSFLSRASSTARALSPPPRPVRPTQADPNPHRASHHARRGQAPAALPHASRCQMRHRAGHGDCPTRSGQWGMYKRPRHADATRRVLCLQTVRDWLGANTPFPPYSQLLH